MMKTSEICAREFNSQRGTEQMTCSYDCHARRRRAVFAAQAAEEYQRRRALNADFLSKALQTGALSR